MKLSGLLAHFSSSSLTFLLHLHFFSFFSFVTCFPYSSSVLSTSSILLSSSLCSFSTALSSLSCAFLLNFFSLPPYPAVFFCSLSVTCTFITYLPFFLFSCSHIIFLFASFDFLNFFLYSSASASIPSSSSSFQTLR
jgi:hypothetical protein